jgi:ribosomal protein S18 acetylase RimI-like enzyme
VIETKIRPICDDDRARVANLIAQQWGAEIVVGHGAVYRPRELPGFVAIDDGTMVGLVTYHIDDAACEIVTLNSVKPGIGIGTALIDAIKRIARQANCTRLWLVTTNDNIDALRFYQKRGFALGAVRRNAVEQSRKIKPQIPLIGEHGIPLRDEIELEMEL